MKLILTATVIALLSSLTCQAGPQRGRLPDAQRETIHELAKHHGTITRKVELTDAGYTAVTTSSEPKIVALLQSHIAYMIKRVESGGQVRRWDPAYREMGGHFDQLTTKVTKLDNGVRVTITGKTPEAVKVAHNHARIVTEFINEGPEAVRRKHDTVLDGKNAEN